MSFMLLIQNRDSYTLSDLAGADLEEARSTAIGILQADPPTLAAAVRARVLHVPRDEDLNLTLLRDGPAAAEVERQEKAELGALIQKYPVDAIALATKAVAASTDQAVADQAVPSGA